MDRYIRYRKSLTKLPLETLCELESLYEGLLDAVYKAKIKILTEKEGKDAFYFNPPNLLNEFYTDDISNNEPTA